MTEIILSAIFLTDENVADADRIYKDKIFAADPETSRQIQVDKVIVTQTIHVPDLFAPHKFKFTYENHWLTRRDWFDQRFNIIDDDNRTDTFALITQK
jgi:hypothetical protein